MFFFNFFYKNIFLLKKTNKNKFKIIKYKFLNERNIK